MKRTLNSNFIKNQSQSQWNPFFHQKNPPIVSFGKVAKSARCQSGSSFGHETDILVDDDSSIQLTRWYGESPRLSTDRSRSFPWKHQRGFFDLSNVSGQDIPILETNPLHLCQRHVSIMGHNKQPSSSASLWLAHTNLRTPSSQVFGLLLLSMGGSWLKPRPKPPSLQHPKKTTVVWKLLRNGAQERWLFSFDGMPWCVYTYSQ